MWKLSKHWGQHLRVATDHLILFQHAMEEIRRRSKNVYDFDDMLLWAWRSLVFNPACLAEFRNRFSHIIVDEVQDSNQLQWDIAHLLSGEASQIITNEPFDADKSYDTTVYDPSRFSPPKAMPPELRGTLIVYGDPAQSIYEFRHARPSKLLAFTQRVDVDVYQLRYNYRSTQGICKLGETIARGKPWNISDCILPVGQNRQVKALASISTYASVSLMEESERIVQEAITKAGQHPEGLNACAVLCRVSIPLCFVELACMKMGIPWVKYASGSFMDSKDIKLVLAYMQAGMGSTYDPGGEILLSLVNKPFRFIKKSFVDSCAEDALGRNTHPIDILQERRDELRPMPQEALNDFISLMTQLNRMAFTLEAQGQSGADKKELPTGARSMIRLILRETDYVRKLREEDGPSAEADRLSALEELLKIADNFEKPSEFLQHIQELRETMKQISLHKKAQKGSRKPKLTLSTIHRAKGLEWPHVFLMGVNHGIFPHGMADIEEETRLFYVAATRAKSTLTVTHTNAPASLDAESDEQEATSPFIEIVKSFLDYEDLRLKLLANSAGVSRAS
jgi:DNA helicase-2/ATP-dependent DNA helicase PcrA